MERSFESPRARSLNKSNQSAGGRSYIHLGGRCQNRVREPMCVLGLRSRPVASRVVRSGPAARRRRHAVSVAPRRGPGSGVARDAGSGGGQCEWRVPRACPRGGRASRPGSGAVRWPGEPPPTSRPLDRCGVSARAPRPRATDAEAKTQSTESTRLPFAFRVPRSEIPSTIPQSMYPHKPCPYGLFIAHHQLAHTCGAVCRR